MEPVSVSVNQAAQALGIGRSKVYELIARGDLETLTIDRRRLIKTASIRALVDAGPPK